jgi:hypothetical protein
MWKNRQNHKERPFVQNIWLSNTALFERLEMSDFLLSVPADM